MASLVNVEIDCIPDNVYAISGIANHKMARFDIRTGSSSDTQSRSPLNLALILDRSGSMEGDQKLTFAKQAIISALKLLHDDDIIHLVAYDDSVQVIFENARAASREVLFPLVERIETGGSTNISGAIETGAELLKKYSCEGMANRMFLLSDGQANVGLQTAPELTKLVSQFRQLGILTDSFGIGADFDGVIMKGIADAGGSRFYFLESIRVIESFVSKALMSVFKVCGSQTRLVIRGQNGSVVTKIWGHENLVDGAQLGDLHVNNVRSVLCEFTTSATHADPTIEVPSLTYELSFHQPNDLQAAPTVIRKVLHLKFVDDDSLMSQVDPQVKVMHVTQEAARMDAEIADLVKNNQVEQALELVEKQLELLKSVEQFDGERKSIGLLIQIAEKMRGKLKVDNVDRDLVCQGYHHQSYLKRQASCEYMEEFGLYD